MLELWLGAMTQGLAYAFLAWGIYLTFRVLNFADITVDGSFTLGAATAAVLLFNGVNPVWAMLAAIAAGALAGVVTGIIHTRFGITDLLSGILTMTALYSINLRVMKASNVSLQAKSTILSVIPQTHRQLENGGEEWLWFGLFPLDESWIWFGLFLLLAVVCKLALDWFLRTDYGMALRATGDNPLMITAQGVDIRRMKVVGLALANASVGLSGALIAQYQGFADVGMGIGSLVAGLAAVILGETLMGRRTLAWLVAGVAAGSIVFRLLIALALRVGLNPNDLKLITAAFVLVVLVLPGLRVPRRLVQRWRPRAVEASPETVTP